MANSLDPDETAPIGEVCFGSTLFASLLNSSVMLGNYLQQTTSADDIFRCFFLGACRVKFISNGLFFGVMEVSVSMVEDLSMLNHVYVLTLWTLIKYTTITNICWL